MQCSIGSGNGVEKEDLLELWEPHLCHGGEPEGHIPYRSTGQIGDTQCAHSLAANLLSLHYRGVLTLWVVNSESYTVCRVHGLFWAVWFIVSVPVCWQCQVNGEIWTFHRNMIDLCICAYSCGMCFSPTKWAHPFIVCVSASWASQSYSDLSASWAS